MSNWERYADTPEQAVTELERRLEGRVRQVDGYFSIQKQLMACLIEWLPIAENHLARIVDIAPPGQREAVEQTAAFKVANQRVERMRAAINRARDGATY
jgi:hypothetical protein